MNNDLWLLLDCNFLCHRAYHVMNHLCFGSVRTGVLYGFLSEVVALRERFHTDNIIFCFDSKYNKRVEIYPDYKANRKPKDDDLEELKRRKQLKSQITLLKDEYLGDIGFKNIICHKGFEADDAIAAFIQVGPLVHDDYDDLVSDCAFDAVIVSSDKDLYQLLSGSVSMWNPMKKKLITLQTFYEEYGVEPLYWPKVKAIAGCATDNIKGVQGVGEKTALKYVRKLLPKTSSYHKKIVEARDVWKENLKLVCLPFNECPSYIVERDVVTKYSWRVFCDNFGLKSLRNKWT